MDSARIRVVEHGNLLFAARDDGTPRSDTRDFSTALEADPLEFHFVMASSAATVANIDPVDLPLVNRLLAIRIILILVVLAICLDNVQVLHHGRDVTVGSGHTEN